MILYECYEKVRKAQQDKPDNTKPKEKKRIEPGMIIHCKTKEIEEKLLKHLDKLGYKWRTGRSLLGADTGWAAYENKVCYRIEKDKTVVYGHKAMYEPERIIEAENALPGE